MEKENKRNLEIPIIDCPKAGYTISMKKHEQLPDFSKLCRPEQNHISLFISQQIFFFFLCSIFGFLWEVALIFATERQFANRGFLYGPWLPVYGVGAVLLLLSLSPVKKHPAAVFLLSALIGTGVELAVGWLLDTVWDLQYWDYSGYPLNYRGYICLWSALGFGVAGVLWVCVLSGLITRLWLRLPSSVRRGINTLLVLLFLTDCAAALIFPNIGKNITFP